MSIHLRRGLGSLGYGGKTAGSGNVDPTFGGRVVLGAGAAALGASALDTDSSNSGKDSSHDANFQVPADAKSLPSAQHLEAPLNGMISAWLEQNAPIVDALFKITGLKPTQLIDRLVTGVLNRGVAATPENINSVALDIIDSAPERVALRHDNWEHKQGEKMHVIDPSSESWSNTRTAVAIIETASALFPTGIQGIIALREALFMNPQDFDACVRHIHLRDMNAEYGNVIEDRSERVRVIL